MELHRLGELPDDFNSKLFNKLYKETEGLRRNLANQIDQRRYGVTKDIILSWFDDKFIFVFTKYMDSRDEKHLKYSLINALSLFKCRVLRKAYSGESEIYSNTISIINRDDETDIFDIIPIQDEISDGDLFLELALSFLKKKLEDDAYLLLELQINPPAFILDRVRSKFNITTKVLVEYFSLPPNKESYKYIESLKQSIAHYTKEAHEHFKSQASFDMV